MKAPVHEGVVECAGLLLDARRGQAPARAFILENLEELRSVAETPRGLFVRFDRPRPVRADRAVGLVVTTASRDGSEFLLGVPVDERALEELAPPAGSLVLAWHGAVEVLVPPFREVDPSLWIDLDDVHVVNTMPLGPPPRPPKLELPVARPLATILGAELPLAPTREATAVVEAMQKLAASVATGEAAGAPGARPRALTAVATAIAATLSFFRDLLRTRTSTSDGSAPGGSPSEDALAMPPGPPSFLRRIVDRIDRWIRRGIAMSRLSSWLFRKQAEYVARLLESFDEGDLDEALRRAIPLGKEGGAQGEGSIALGLPPPRASLSISSRGLRPGGASLSFGPNLYEQLRLRYRRAFERLEREGRVAEAAFVLADLLQDAEAAVAFLERHGMLREAAELAESRVLAPGLVVRQWFRAGDRTRAIRVARRRGGALDAIARLDRSGHTVDADALRRLYAEHLASAGDFAGAVDLAWRVTEARALVVTWVERGREQGGAPGARMLALQLVHELRPAEQITASVHEVAFEAGPDGRSSRLAFAEALSLQRKQTPSPKGDALARVMARALYADAPASHDRRLEGMTTAMIELARDPGLRVDKPRWPAIPFGRHYRHVVRAEDRGRTKVFDAVPVGRGRTVLALGEAGVALVDARGKTVAHFDQPAEALVVSDSLDRLLTVAPRGSVSKVGRIDLVSRRSEPFCEVELETFARTFDGATWLATIAPERAAPSDLVVIDVCDTELSLLSRVNAVGALSLDVARAPDHVDVVSASGDGGCWAHTYELPGLTLRRRWDLSVEDASHQLWLIAPDSVFLGLVHKRDAGCLAMTRGQHELWRQTSLEFGTIERASQRHALGRNFLALGTRQEATFVVKVLARKDLSSVGELAFEDAEDARLRMVGQTLVLTDAHGRVFAVDLGTGEIVRNVRI